MGISIAGGGGKASSRAPIVGYNAPHLLYVRLPDGEAKFVQ
jgi:hypothetical protein